MFVPIFSKPSVLLLQSTGNPFLIPINLVAGWSIVDGWMLTSSPLRYKLCPWYGITIMQADFYQSFQNWTIQNSLKILWKEMFHYLWIINKCFYFCLKFISLIAISFLLWNLWHYYEILRILFYFKIIIHIMHNNFVIFLWTQRKCNKTKYSINRLHRRYSFLWALHVRHLVLWNKMLHLEYAYNKIWVR